MRVFKIILLLAILPVAAFAQRTAADSMYIFKQDRQIVDFVQQNGTQLISSGIEKLSTADVKLQTANGHFRTSQTAETGTDASFGTSGITTLGRFKLFGDFRFTRTWQDSLAWTMKGVQEDANPYYFAAGKAGTYQRINYSLNGLGSYAVIPNKLYLASGLDYFYNTASRSVDPRPSVQTFRLLLKPELTYQQKDHAFGANFLWGYEHEENGVGFRNSAYSSGTAYPDRIVYQILGYGSFTETGNSNRKTRRRGTYIGGGFNYAYNSPAKYLRAKFNYSEHDEEVQTPIERSVNYNRLGTFYLKRYDIDLITGTNGQHYRHQLLISGYYNPGKDQRADLNASSYKYSASSALVAYSIQTKNASSINTELGLSAMYYDRSQRDLSASHTFQFTYIQPGIQAHLYKKYADAGRLMLTLAPALRLPVANTLAIPTGESNQFFNYGITYPDHSYYTSTVGVLNSGAEYVTPHLLKGVYSSIAINSSFYKPFKTGTVYPGTTFIPSGNFLEATFSFNIYF